MASNLWNQAQPNVKRGRQFWVRQTRERKILLAVVGLVVAVAAVAVPITVTSYVLSPDPNSPEGACAALKGATTDDAIAWEKGRRAAGLSKDELMSMEMQAAKICPGTFDAALLGTN